MFLRATQQQRKKIKIYIYIYFLDWRKIAKVRYSPKENIYIYRKTHISIDTQLSSSRSSRFLACGEQLGLILFPSEKLYHRQTWLWLKSKQTRKSVSFVQYRFRPRPHGRWRGNHTHKKERKEILIDIQHKQARTITTDHWNDDVHHPCLVYAMAKDHPSLRQRCALLSGPRLGKPLRAPGFCPVPW